MGTMKSFSGDDGWVHNEAEQTVQAIRSGCVDAFVVEEADGFQVHTLEGSDLPYGVLVEQMQQGAAMLNCDGEIIYCNPSLALLLGISREAAIGVPLSDFVDAGDHPCYQNLLMEKQAGPGDGEMCLRRPDCTLIPAKFSFRRLSKDRLTIGVLIFDLTAEKQMAQLASHVLQVRDEERRRIARDLHDSVGQLLVALSMDNLKITQEVDKLSSEAANALRSSVATVDEIGKEIRTIAHLLHPPLLDEVGLPAALRWYIDGFAQRSNIDTVLDMPENLRRLPAESEITVFRVVQECLTNVHRHANTRSCEVKIFQDQNQLFVTVSDSGKGIPKDKQLSLQAGEGVGLRGMRERLKQLGGTLELASNENGTIVTATLTLALSEGSSSRREG